MSSRCWKNELLARGTAEVGILKEKLDERGSHERTAPTVVNVLQLSSTAGEARNGPIG